MRLFNLDAGDPPTDNGVIMGIGLSSLKRVTAARQPKDLLPSEFRSRQHGLRSAPTHFDEDCPSEARGSFGERRGRAFFTATLCR